MWRFIGTAPDERSFLIDGVNVWAFPWHEVEGEVAAVEDPHYHQPFNFSVYTVTDTQRSYGHRTIKFAAGEFSNGVWGFYVPI